MKLRAENLVKDYGSKKALDRVSIEIESGNIVAVLGANGAGKTTLINALAGTIPVDSGRVFFDDQLYTSAREDLRRRFALLPDIPPVAGYWTPLRLIGSMLKLYERSAEQGRIEALLEQLELLPVAGWKLNRLSRGQVYKSVLAAFVAADPELWFVDEPFSSGMDPRGLNCFKEYARQAVTRGHIIIYTTQIIEVAEQFSSRVCVLDKGKIQAYDMVECMGDGEQLDAILAQLRETPEA